MSASPIVDLEVPRLPGHSSLRNLVRFRRDRIGVLLELARERRDIVAMKMGVFRRVVLITDPGLAHDVFVTRQGDLVKAPGLAVFLKPVLGAGLLTSEKSKHERQRRFLAPAFAPKRIAGYATVMAERSRRFVARMQPGARIDLAAEMMRLTFDIVGKTLFDAEVEGDAAEVGAALTTAMEVSISQLTSILPVPPHIPTFQNLRYQRAVRRLDALVYGIIEKRRKDPRDHGDVLSTLLVGEASAMTDTQVRDEAMTLFMAGHETTANALAWTFYLLAKHPEVRTRMEGELDALGHAPEQEDLRHLPYTLAVFKEAMRLYPPAYVIGRRPDSDITIGAHRVDKNSIVIVNVIGIHRRGDLWPDPDRFDPERFLGEREKRIPRGAYLPFGAGPRVCIGNHFALLEGHLALATIARGLRFDLTSAAPVEHEPLVTLRPRGGMPVRVSLRS